MTNLAPQAATGDVSESSGNFTVTMTATGGGTITLNSAFDSLEWYRQGKLVNVHGSVEVSSVSSPLGGLQVQSMPFFKDNTPSEWQDIYRDPIWINAYTGTLTSGGPWVDGFLNAGAKAMQIRDDGVADLAPHVIAGTGFAFNFWYVTNDA